METFCLLLLGQPMAKLMPNVPQSKIPTALSGDHGSLLSVSIDLPFLDTSYRWNHTICGLLYLASFTQHVFKVLPYCSMYQYFIPLHC